jgi:diguanylate cyclase (GGDEF)-like protein
VDFRTIKYRLTNDFQLAVMTLLGMIAVLGITPFTALRAINGQWEAFTADLLIQAGILGSVLHAWLTGDTHNPSLFLTYFIGTMVIVAIFIIGTAAEYWLYPTIVASFFLVHRRHALGITLLGVAVLLLSGIVHIPTTETASYFITVIVCAFLSYAFAYRTAIQRDQLETLASRDALTGIYNRRTMLDELERAHKSFAREQSPCGILLLDLDHFKRINDRYGHQAGDQVLLDLARLLERTVRISDRVFRFGGEEFLILIQKTNRKGMMSLAEKLRKAVETKIHDPDSNSITISIGGALLHPGESIDDWFGRADKYLYAAKEAGRNRVIFGSE